MRLSKKTFLALLLSLLTVNLPFFETSSVLAISSSYVQTSGRNFVLDGQNWSHIGVNSAGLAHYGAGGDWGPLKWATEADQDTQLAAARDMGAKAVRIFAANENLTHAQSAARVKALADKSYYTYGIRLLVSFTNFYDSPYNPQGDQVYYAIDLNGYTVLKHEFFASGFRNNYLPWVKTLVQELKDHPGVFAWELGNELKDATFSNSNPQTLVDFSNEVVAEIRLIDTTHLITSGIISAENANLSDNQARQLYENLSFINNHNYDESNDLNNDLWLAIEQNKPHIIGEAGFPGNDRGPLVDADVNDWLTRDTQGYYQWGFMATDWDIGDGDAVWGMDKIFHNDWDSLFSIYQQLTIPGDLNGDCVVNMVDIMKVAAIWGTEEGDERFNPEFDFDDDGRITVADIMYVAAKWGDQCPD